MKRYFSLIVFLLLLTACQNNEVYSKYDRDFLENRWQARDVKTYTFDIADDTQVYDLVFHFSHVYGYQFPFIPLQFTLQGPGKTTQQKVELQLKDSSGKELGDCSGDYCDLEYVFLKGAPLEKGHYTLEVSHLFTGPYLPNVLGTGVRVMGHDKK